MNRAKIILAASLLAFAHAAPAQGAPRSEQVKSGSETYARHCAACHGPDGNKPSAPDQPILAGQYYDYLVRALGDYKNGRRNNAIMKGFAEQLSKQDIEDLAAWFSSQAKTSLHDQR